MPNYCCPAHHPPFPQLSHFSFHDTMATSEPRTIDNAPPDIDRYSPATTKLNAGIQSLTTSMQGVEDSTVKAVFESVLTILTLVRVRFSFDSYLSTR